MLRLGNSVLGPTHRVDVVDLGAQPRCVIAPYGIAVVGGLIDMLEPVVRRLDMVTLV